MSYSPREKNETKPDVKKSNLEKLINSVFMDPDYQLIYKKDIQNIIYQENNTYVANKESLNKFSKQSKLSEAEFNYLIPAVSGFRDQKDFSNYMDLYRHLIKKYEIDKLSANDQQYFFNALKNREIEYTGELAELSKNPFKRDSLNEVYRSTSGMRPECWKCAYDYQACMNPIVGLTTISVNTVSTSVYYVKFTSSSGNSTTFSVTSYNDPNAPVVTYTAPVLQTSSCTVMYKSCISQCNQP